MPVTQIMSVVGRTGGGGPPPPPPYTGTDFFYAPDQNNWIAFGGLQSGSAFSNPAPANPAYVPPDGSYTGKTLDFTGSEWMISTNLGFGGAWTPNGGSITINLWFYPTANNCQIMSELGTQDPASGYHYTIFEIDTGGYIRARFWNGTGTQAITSNNTVILNQWNHIRFAEDTQGGHYLEVNGIATNSQTYYTRSSPGAYSEYFAVGISDATYMVATNRFQGKLGYLQISDYLAPSTYTANFSRFKSINTGVVLGTSWTIELIAELVPTSFWASIWGHDNNGTGEGHLAYFSGSTSNLNVGSWLGMDAYNVGGVDQKGYWAFSHANGGGINMYRNGVLVNPNVAGYVQGQPAANTLLIGTRHLNSGGGGSTDPCPGNYYYTNVINGTALDAAGILASYNALKPTYFPTRSLVFNQSENDYLEVGASADWALGSSWTIEFWSKNSTATVLNGPGLYTVLCQNFNGNGIDIYYQDGKLKINNGTVTANEPTPNIWTHVALVNDAGTTTLYYNGSSVYTGGNWNLGNTTDSLVVGRRGPGNFQFFDGKLAMVRISNTAKYATTFTPTVTYGVESDTKLFIESNPSIVDSKSHSITNNGVVVSTDMPT